jgi:hypothetical protein
MALTVMEFAVSCPVLYFKDFQSTGKPEIRVYTDLPKDFLSRLAQRMICVVNWLTGFFYAGEIPRGVRWLSCGMRLPAPGCCLPWRCLVPLPLVFLRVVSVLFALNIGVHKGHEFLKSGESVLAHLET